MRETLNIVRYKCDLCEKTEDVPNKGLSPFLRISLPSYHYDERKMRCKALRTANFDICEECANKMLKNLKEHYKIYSVDYMGDFIERV